MSNLSFKNVKVDAFILAHLVRMNADVEGIDLSDQNLNGMNLTGLNFTKANLRNSSCVGTLFNKANFTNADFTQANFTRANFSGADLTGISTNSTGTIWTDSVLREIDSTEIDKIFQSKDGLPENASFTSEQVVQMQRTNFDGISLRPKGAKTLIAGNFEKKDLSNRSFNRATMEHTNFCGTNLTNTTFENAQLSHIKVDDQTNLDGTNFTNAKLNDADLSPVTITATTTLKGVNLQRSTLNRSWVDQALAQKVDIKDVILNKLDLANVDFTNVNLQGAQFIQVDLTNANFEGADLTSIKMDDDTKLAQTKFTNAKLIKADLKAFVIDQFTVITNANLTGSKLNRSWVEQAIAQKVVNLNNVDLTDVNLNQLDLSNLNLDNANLKGANLTGTTLNKSGMTAAVKSGAVLNRTLVEHAIAEGLDLKNADLSKLDLNGLDLSKLDLEGANLKDAVLTGTHLNRSGLVAAIQSRSVMTKDIQTNVESRMSLDLKGIVLKGSQADPLSLSSCSDKLKLDLSYADFTDAKIEYCILSSANLSNANFSGVDLSTSLLDSVNGGDTVIIKDSDCKPYIEAYTSRLNFIVNNIKDDREDEVYGISSATFNTFHKGIFHPISQSGLTTGDTFTFDNGAQNFYEKSIGTLDTRTFAEEDQKTELQDYVNESLLGNTFSNKQKELFYQARSATWTIGNLTASITSEKHQQYYESIEKLDNEKNAETLTQTEYNEKKSKLEQQLAIDSSKFGTSKIQDLIYLSNHVTHQRLRPELMGKIFDIVATKFHEMPENKGTNIDIAAVKKLFLDIRFKW